MRSYRGVLEKLPMFQYNRSSAKYAVLVQRQEIARNLEALAFVIVGGVMKFVASRVKKSDLNFEKNCALGAWPAALYGATGQTLRYWGQPEGRRLRI